jgi:hypothetical protein
MFGTGDLIPVLPSYGSIVGVQRSDLAIIQSMRAGETTRPSIETVVGFCGMIHQEQREFLPQIAHNMLL